MAQVTARKRGKAWEYRFETASVDGKRKQKSKGGFRTKAEAIKAGTAALTEYNQTGQTVKTDNQISVSDFCDLWFCEAVENHKKYNTVRNTQSIIKNHIKPSIGGYRLSAVTHSTIQRLINEKSETYAKTHVRRILSVIHAMMDYACEPKRIISRNPADRVKIPKTAKDKAENVHAYTAEECAEFAEKLKDCKVAYYAFMIAFYTGMRIGEICGLTWEDIDMDNCEIHVKHAAVTRTKKGTAATSVAITTPKTPKSISTIGFGEGLKAILKRIDIERKESALYYGEYWQRNYMREDGQVVTSNRIMPDEMRFVLRMENGAISKPQYLEKIFRTKIGEGFRFHNIRHTHATLLIEQGVPLTEVSDRMRHASPATTMGTYAEATKMTHAMAVHAIEKAWTNGGQNKAI